MPACACPAGPPIRARAALLALALLAAPAAHAQIQAQAPDRPMRIVSLNMCTDELLMRLVEPERIASITFLSKAPDGAPPGLEQIAAALPANHGLAEEVIAQRPDLIVAGAFTTRPAVQLLRRLGYAVIDFAPEADFDDMRAHILLMGDAVGETARAAALVADMDARLDALWDSLPGDAPVYADIGANFYLPGAGTLAAAITNAGGYRTLGQTLGVQGAANLPLEQIVLADPDLISNSAAPAGPPAMATQSLRHPALRRLTARAETVEIPSRLWACGAPSALRAAEILAAAHGADR
mgnify:CR=1 FL=1